MRAGLNTEAHREVAAAGTTELPHVISNIHDVHVNGRSNTHDLEVNGKCPKDDDELFGLSHPRGQELWQFLHDALPHTCSKRRFQLAKGMLIEEIDVATLVSAARSSMVVLGVFMFIWNFVCISFIFLWTPYHRYSKEFADLMLLMHGCTCAYTTYAMHDGTVSKIL